MVKRTVWSDRSLGLHQGRVAADRDARGAGSRERERLARGGRRFRRRRVGRGR